MQRIIDERERNDKISLFSSSSRRVSLEAIRYGKHNLDAKRQSLLDRIPASGMWTKVESGSLKMIDLAYLTAGTGHEFALLQSKKFDILYHGTATDCDVLSDYELQECFLNKKLKIIGHSHSGEMFPEPSINDRKFLWFIEQKESLVISAMTGICISYEAAYS